MSRPEPDDEGASIRQAEQQEATAFASGDAEMLERLWHPDLIVNAPHGRITDDRDAILAAVRSGRLHHARLERRPEAVRRLGNMAVTMGIEIVEDDAGPLAGPPYARRYTNVWQLDETGWRLWARQAAVLRDGAPSAGQVPA